MMKSKDLISIVVPCFNEEESLPIFYAEASKVLKSMKVDYELIFVDDGSKDNTLQIASEIALKDNKVIYLSFSRNFGKESAMYAGLCNAKGYYVAIMDADMQDPPVLLPKMYEILKKDDYDSIATRRITRKGESKTRTWFARRFYKIINLMSDADIVDGARDFRLMKRPMVDSIISMSEKNRFSKGIFGWVGFKTYWLPFENIERVAGTTKWSFIGLFKYAIDGIIDFSQTPIAMILWLSIFVVSISFIILLILVIKNLIIGKAIFDIATTICTIIFIGSIELLSLGLLGQYVGKTYSEIRNRPQYIISKTNIK